MEGKITIDPMHDSASFSADFQRAFVAVRYFLGARGDDLAAPLGDSAREAVQWLERLAGADRQRRAEVLASEVGHVVRALEARTFR